MKKPSQFKGFITGMLTMALVFSLGTAAIATYQQNLLVTYSDIKLTINGSYYTPTDASGRVVEPFIYQGTTYLPVRGVAEAVGYNVGWDQASMTVSLSGGGGGTATGGTTGTTPGTSTGGVTANLVATYNPYASDDADEYAKASGKSFLMGGKEYTDSIRFDGWAAPEISYNIEGRYTTLGMEIGFEDNSNTRGYVDTRTFSFYGDGNLLETVDVTYGDLPINVSINVTGVSALRIAVSGGEQYSGEPAIGNPTLS